MITIGITVPGSSIHGGIRILYEWSNRLSQNHKVFIIDSSRKAKRPTWFNLNPAINIYKQIKPCDILIIGSPHAIDLQDHPYAKKVFVFLQMMEHLFRPHDHKWLQQCIRTYTTAHPLIVGSYWIHNWAVEKYGRTGPTYYVGDGVNLQDFPIRQSAKDGKTILLESPIPSNPAKDVDMIALKVAGRLKREGYKIIAYGAHRIISMENIDEYYQAPNLSKMNDLYSRATILIKATKYDSRALAPMEAMTKGTVTARAIVNGDDALVNNVTALRCGYDEEELYNLAKQLLIDDWLRIELADNCLFYVQDFGWDFWMDRIKAILSGYGQGSLITKPNYACAQ